MRWLKEMEIRGERERGDKLMQQMEKSRKEKGRGCRWRNLERRRTIPEEI